MLCPFRPIPASRAHGLTVSPFALVLTDRPGHYARALEDAVASHKNQWPRSWEDKSPLAGGATFGSLNPTERVRIL
jgi:hypothetical protein